MIRAIFDLIFIVGGVSIILIVCIEAANARDVRLGWDANTDADLMGYNLWRYEMNPDTGQTTAPVQVNTATIAPNCTPEQAQAGCTETYDDNGLDDAKVFVWQVEAVGTGQVYSRGSNLQLTPVTAVISRPGGLRIEP